MKRVFILLLLAGAIGGGLWYYKRETDLLKKFKVDIAGYKVTDYTIANMNLVVTFMITSYNSIEGEITGSNLDIYINGSYVGNAFNNESQIIPAHGYNYVNVNLKLNNAQLVQSALNIIAADKNKAISIRTVGTVKVKTGFIAMNIPVDDTQTTSLTKLLK